jgi:hypothetical protein
MDIDHGCFNILVTQQFHCIVAGTSSLTILCFARVYLYTLALRWLNFVIFWVHARFVVEMNNFACLNSSDFDDCSIISQKGNFSMESVID